MAKPLRHMWVFYINDFDTFQYFYDPVVRISSCEMLVPGKQVQKFKLEFFVEEDTIYFHVLFISFGCLVSKIKVSTMDQECEFGSSNWMAVNDSSGPFRLMSCEALRQLCEWSSGIPVKFSCEVETFRGSQVVEGLPICEFEHRMKGRAHLVDDLAKAVSKEDAPFSDITLTCQDRCFASHKVLLAARSDVFAAMFSHEGMAEASTGSVEIMDMEPSTLEKMLQFIYTDQLGEEVSFESTCQLLAAADRYNILPLTALCEHLISSKVSVNTAMPALTYAYLCGSEILKSFLLDFTKNNMSKLHQTSEWKEITEAKSGVFLEIIKDLLESYIGDTIDTTV